MRLAATGFLVGFAAARGAAGQDPKPAKYPLHLHIIASDDSHKTVRMQSSAGVASAGEGGMSIPDFESMAQSGGGGNSGGMVLGGGDDDFSGSGRADLVSPPVTTQGLTYTYEGCSRIRVLAGFQSLAARWKKSGQKLEVLLPSDEISGSGRTPAFEKCTLKVKLQEIVYLRMRNGKILQVSQADYWKKPSLRMFLSGPVLTLQPRRAAVKATPEN